jgi:hypothetical protein
LSSKMELKSRISIEGTCDILAVELAAVVRKHMDYAANNGPSMMCNYSDCSNLG